MRTPLYLVGLITSLCPSLAIADGVLARCGASFGTGYFFHDDVTNPGGPEWSTDRITDGNLLLVRLGDEWDIQFGDSIGEYGYRQDGAEVIPLGQADGMLTVGAFRGTYTDIFTFDFEGDEVVWTSHKTGTVIKKVAVYRAECTVMKWPG